MFGERARYYVETLGWPVFPVGRNKHPLVPKDRDPATGQDIPDTGGVKKASADPAQITVWDSLYPDANVALATGEPSGIVVIDIDGPAGEASWRKLVRLVWFQTEPDCPQAMTAKGRHLYFRGIGIGNRVNSVLGQGIDVRGDGGSAILPPSVHASGTIYEWLDPPHLLKPPWLPPALIRLIAGEQAWPVPRRYPVRPEPRHGDTPPDLDKLVNMVRDATEGERNHVLNTAAFLAAKTVAHAVCSESDVMAALTAAGLSCGLYRDEIKATVASGLRAGRRKL